MKFGYYVNGEKREPTKEEVQIMTDRFMETLGLERKETYDKNKALSGKESETS